MASKNYTLAKDIIDKVGKIEVVINVDKPAWGCNLDAVIGVSFGSVKEAEADAKKDIIKQLAAILDDGTLVLSDTWAEDNLGA